MFFLINRTKRKTCKEEALTIRSNEGKKWPLVSELGEFASPGDTLELIEISTENKHYYGAAYIQQQPLTYGKEQINEDGTDYVSAKEKAIAWLAERITPTNRILPEPRCPGCFEKFERDESNLQSLADTGQCWSCRTPKRDVIVPRPKKKRK